MTSSFAAPPRAAGEAPASTAAGGSAKREGKEKKAVKNYLFGLNCVGAALAAKRRAVYKLTMCEEIEYCEIANSDAYKQIKRTVEELKIPVEKKRECYFQNAGVDDPKQGMMLAVGPLDTIKITMLNRVQKGEPYSAIGKMSDVRYEPRAGVWPLWLALDRIVDPTNFGVILRSAHFFGVDGIVVTSENRAPLSWTVSKASGGVLEVMPIHEVDALDFFLQRSAKQGWNVVAAAGEKTLVAGRRLPDVSTRGPLDGPTVVVFGSEGNGLHESVLERCQYVFSIRGLGVRRTDRVQVPGMDSLNVSVAVGCLLHRMRSYRGAAAGAKTAAADESTSRDSPAEAEDAAGVGG